MVSNMPEVNAEFGVTPTIAFPTDKPPVGLKSIEIVEGDGPMVRRGDTVTVGQGCSLRLQFRTSSAGEFRYRRGAGDSWMGYDGSRP